MKRIIIAAALAGTTITGFAAAQTAVQSSAPQQRPHRGMALDANKDGVITRAEVLAAIDARFAALDANRDGKISATERPGGKGNKPDMTREQMRAKVLAHFDRADANRDGTLDATERQSFRGKHGGRGGPGAGEDGRRGGMHRGGGGMGALMRADANRDGVITKAEMTAAAGAMFDRLDTNHDGRIDQNERQAMRDGMRARRGGGDAGPGMRPGGQTGARMGGGQNRDDIGAAVREGDNR